MNYTRNLYHIIFRTRYGVPSIVEENEEYLYRYIWGFVREHHSVLYRVNGMPDHIHLLVELHPTLSVAEFVQKLKTTPINGLMKISIYFLNFMRGREDIVL
ncbi:hypothetical protein HMPREF0027_2118 [Actinobacillus ureae ATCC 25976]|uniref:Transposase IS200-like domain-containing protein n=1 Tax=Actinobacillus ureae ATCC 25976 TaxID=887324 RepID=E8KJV1_9PAST|nr:hypothetical protein HMPREF0027_2118 [Actinobacillus ureae ATCC 25976]